MATAVDLFAGAGGLSRGLKSAGFKVVAAADSWHPAVTSYRANFDDHPCYELDVSKLNARTVASWDLPEIDLVAGGPPCQGFSIQRIGADMDDRNNLIFAFAKAIRLIKPKMFMMENVPGLLGHRGKAIAERFIQQMQDEGFEVRAQIVNAADFGVPQLRRRVFLIGWRAGAYSEFSFPRPTHTGEMLQSVGAAFKGLKEPPADYSPAPGDALHRRMKLSAINEKRIALIPPGGGFEDLPVELRVKCHQGGAAKIGHRNVYGRLDKDRPAVTITGRFDSFTRGRFGHPTQHRNISLREGARLQSFPDNHVFIGTQEEIAAQIGNAIPPLLAAAMGKAVLTHLNSAKTRVAEVRDEQDRAGLSTAA
jgi:DNA (cytosine-5)-methyltransferase 1